MNKDRYFKVLDVVLATLSGLPTTECLMVLSRAVVKVLEDAIIQGGMTREQAIEMLKNMSGLSVILPEESDVKTERKLDFEVNQ